MAAQSFSFPPEAVRENREHLDSLVSSFLDNCVDLRDINLGYDLRSLGFLDTVNWPHGNILGFGWVLGVRDDHGGLEGLDIWRSMGGVERDMIGRVPVFRSNSQSEGKGKERIDGGNKISGSIDGQGSRLLRRQWELSEDATVPD